MEQNASIVFLDEPTSALDVHTESLLLSSLRKLHESQNPTTIIIAHRLSTVVDADKIIVMSHGQVVEQGTHQELVALGGVYAKMWERQVSGTKHASELCVLLPKLSTLHARPV